MMTTFEQAKRMSKSDENSTTVKEASSGISTAMPSLADIPKPPMRRPLPEASGDASASATTAQKEPEEIQAVVLPMTPASAPPRPDMAPSRPQFSASELPVASEPVASEDVPKKNEKEKEEEIAPIVRVPSFMASAATPAQETVVTPLGEQEEISSKKSKETIKKNRLYQLKTL